LPERKSGELEGGEITALKRTRKTPLEKKKRKGANQESRGGGLRQKGEVASPPSRRGEGVKGKDTTEKFLNCGGGGNFRDEKKWKQTLLGGGAREIRGGEAELGLRERKESPRGECRGESDKRGEGLLVGGGEKKGNCPSPP